MNSLSQNLADLLPTLRQNAERTQASLASAIGRSAGYISQIENRETTPSLADVDKLGPALYVDPLFLVGLTDEAIEVHGLMSRLNAAERRRAVELFKVALKLAEIVRRCP
jgi:transcriptional regulator with XRE-family HTH domain